MAIDYPSIYNKITQLYSRFSYLLPLGYSFLPIHVCFVISDSCNHECDTCTFKIIKDYMEKQETEYGSLDSSKAKEIIDQFPNFCFFTFVGGEPLCRKDTIDILKYTAEKKRCSLITNGALISEEIAENLVDMGPRRLFHKGLTAIAIGKKSL